MCSQGEAGGGVVAATGGDRGYGVSVWVWECMREYTRAPLAPGLPAMHSRQPLVIRWRGQGWGEGGCIS